MRTPLPCPASSSRAGEAEPRPRARRRHPHEARGSCARSSRPWTLAGTCSAATDLGAKQPVGQPRARLRPRRTHRGGVDRVSEDGLSSADRIVVDGQTVDTVPAPVRRDPEPRRGGARLTAACSSPTSLMKSVRGGARLPPPASRARRSSSARRPTCRRWRSRSACAAARSSPWSTIDGGEERNERRRVYAVSGRNGHVRPRPARRPRRAPQRHGVHDDDDPPRRGPERRALLMWSTIASEVDQDRHTPTSASPR